MVAEIAMAAATNTDFKFTASLMPAPSLAEPDRLGGENGLDNLR